jgi:hypothetical protein
VLAAALLAACGGGHPAAARGTQRGAGGIAYQWPPTGTAGPPSPGLFCRLLVDDFQHLKSVGAGSSIERRTQVIDDFTGLTPAVDRAAPVAIAGAASTYLQAESAVLVAAARADFDITRFDRSTLAALEAPPVSAAGADLEAYSKSACHYDLSSDPAFGPQS